MGPVDTGVVADIGWPDSTVGAVGAVVHGDVTGSLGEPGRGGGSALTGPGIFGQASGVGYPGDGEVGDESRRYICDSNDGDGSRSYTCNPNDGVRPGRYTSGRNDNARPGGAASDRDDGRGARRPPRMVHRRRAVPRSTTSDDKRLLEMKIEERLMEQRSLAIRCPRRVFEIDHDELLVFLHGSKTCD